MKPCYLKGIDMYLHCKECDGGRDKPCYATRDEVVAHLAEFQKLRLDFDNGKLEELVAASRGEFDLW